MKLLQFHKLINIVVIILLCFILFNKAHANNSCEVIQTLRSMATNHFRKQLGKKDEINYESTYKMPGSSECFINFDTENSTSDLTCYWYLKRGIDKKPEVIETFESVIKNFHDCIPGSVPLNRRANKRTRGEYVWLNDIAPHGTIYEISINYSWSAPWWEMSIQYSRYPEGNNNAN